MNSDLYDKVSRSLSDKLGVSMMLNVMLAVIVLMQLVYIFNRDEVVIERPMFSMDREMAIHRNEVSQSVAEVWAYNAAMIFGNISSSNYKFVQATAYSFIDSEIAARLEVAHKQILRHMAEAKVSIRFIPDGHLVFDPNLNQVSIYGTRIITPLVNLGDQPKSQRYVYRIGIAMTDFRPWVNFWEEGVVDEGV